MPRFTAEYLITIGTQIFSASGATTEDARIVAEHLVESNLFGLDSHGVIRIPLYVNWVHKGVIKPKGKFNVLKDNGSTVTVDCGYNFGQVGAQKATELAIERAEKHGVACVITRNCNHIGRLGAYTSLVAKADMIALATCNSPRCPDTGHWVVPFGGREGRFHTNPFSYAVPTRGEPIVLDMSTSAISEGKIRLFLNKNEPLSPEQITDAQGQPSTDSKDFYGPPRGFILPFGGPVGYKGTALAMMVDLLSGTLAGDLITDDTLVGNGLCLIVINIANFIEPQKFRHLTDEMVRYVKSSSPSPGSNGVFAPGELDFLNKERFSVTGIDIDGKSWELIIKAGREAGAVLTPYDPVA